MNRRTDEEFKQEVFRRLEKKKKAISIRRGITLSVTVIMLVFLNLPIINVNGTMRYSNPAYVLISNSDKNTSNKYVDNDTIWEIIDSLDIKVYKNGSYAQDEYNCTKKSILSLIMPKFGNLKGMEGEISGPPSDVGIMETILPNNTSTPSHTPPVLDCPSIVPGDTGIAPGDTDIIQKPNKTPAADSTLGTPTVNPSENFTPMPTPSAPNDLITITVMFDNGEQCQIKIVFSAMSKELRETLEKIGELDSID